MSQSNSYPESKRSAFLPAPGADGETSAEARRSRLREFQSHLLERMQAARSGADIHHNQLGILVGQERWLLSLQEAGEIVTVDSITQVPLTQDWYLGLTNIRGTLISVVDFARYQGQPLTVMDKDTRIVAFSTTMGFNSALLVRRVLGLRNVDEMALQSVPQMIDNANLSNSEVVARAEASPARYIDNESQLWTELKLEQLIRDPRFLHVGI